MHYNFKPVFLEAFKTLCFQANLRYPINCRLKEELGNTFFMASATSMIMEQTVMPMGTTK